MIKHPRRFLRFQSVLAVITFVFSLSPSPASAEYVPQRVKYGQTIKVGACLPEGVKSPIYLQTWFKSYSKKTTVAKISSFKLVKDASCENTAPSYGDYRLDAKWKVNVKGEFFLSFYVQNLGEDFDGWPDGVISKSK